MTLNPSLSEQALEQADTLLRQASAGLALPQGRPCSLFRREKPGITSRLALVTGARQKQDAQELAAALASMATLDGTWFESLAAEKGYLNLSLSPSWYEAAWVELLARPEPVALFTPPPLTKSICLLRPPPQGEALAIYGGIPPSPLQRRDNIPYGIWYALYRSEQKGEASLAFDGSVNEPERLVLFVLAQFPHQYRLSAMKNNPRQLYQYLRRTADLFYQYHVSCPRLYPAFAQTLNHGLAALGISWERGLIWRNRMEVL